MKIDTSKHHSKGETQSPFPTGLAKPALRALAAAGYTHLEQLATVSETRLLKLHGLGPNAMKSLRKALEDVGLSFAQPEVTPRISVPRNFPDLWSADRVQQNKAFHQVIEITSHPVDWANEVWDEVLANLTHKDNHNRAIAAQVLCNLAKSDSSKRMLHDFAALFAVTADERFVTARHCLQNLWKVGAAGKEQQMLLLTALEERFHDCVTHKNWSLIRYDIIKCLRDLYDSVPDDDVRLLAFRLVDSETDLKYQKKYASLWRSEAARGKSKESEG
jgi:hypothetical protein